MKFIWENIENVILGNFYVRFPFFADLCRNCLEKYKKLIFGNVTKNVQMIRFATKSPHIKRNRSATIFVLVIDGFPCFVVLLKRVLWYYQIVFSDITKTCFWYYQNLFSGNIWVPLGASRSFWERLGPSESFSESLSDPLGASGSFSEPLGASWSLWESLGGSGNLWETFGSFWEPLGAFGSCWEPLRRFRDAFRNL